MAKTTETTGLTELKIRDAKPELKTKFYGIAPSKGSA